MTLRSAVDELEALASSSSARLKAAIDDLVRAKVRLEGEAAARAAVEELLVQTFRIADLLGRRRALLETDSGSRAVGTRRIKPSDFLAAARWQRTIPFATDPLPLVPPIAFDEAIEDLLLREPRLASGFREVQEVYRSGHGFALARVQGLDQIVTEKVQKALATLGRTGTTLAEAEEVVAITGGWSTAYGETVYRTNLATSYSAGRFRQAADPAIAAVMPAFQFVSVGGAGGDGDNRPHHLAAHGLIAGTTDDVWGEFSPPLGYNCRDQLRLVSVFELRRRGLMDGNEVTRFEPSRFGSAHPDDGFGGGRPDRGVYGLA